MAGEDREGLTGRLLRWPLLLAAVVFAGGAISVEARDTSGLLVLLSGVLLGAFIASEGRSG